jgi:hypothetical protein
MYSLNPGLTEALANERIADLRRHGAGSRQSTPSFGRLRTLKKATGWALVEVGLRLALPRRSLDGRRGVARPDTTVGVAR